MDQPACSAEAHTSPLPPAPALRWDVFCRVIDNLGDIGVCWRLCAKLAARGQRVRLWIDQPAALQWMAPGALEARVPGIEVRPWDTPVPSAEAEADVWVESFGCEPPDQRVAALAQGLAAGGRAPVWINLEYLCAEPYVERSHRLPSLVSSGPLRGLGKWFFYPGFTPRTGGLLREADLLQRQAAFDADAWLASDHLSLFTLTDHTHRRRVSLFCYEPADLPAVLQQAAEDAQASDWLITPGRAAAAVAHLQFLPPEAGCRLRHLPALTQRDFDHLLWTCDLNFVRGEDSLVRALWAGKPFVWHIYPQHDDAHHAKLEAFLDWLEAPASLRAFHRGWNRTGEAPARWPSWAVVDSWQACVQAARQRLLAQPDLASQLIGFVMEKR
jgi:uncharacterized repeat protein (TIGR03837 family)